MNYKKLYSLLFNAITDAITNIDREDHALARHILIRAQQQAEELYISSGKTKNSASKRCIGFDDDGCPSTPPQT